MRYFTAKSRIIITQHPNAAMVGLKGTVERLRIADDGAWVKMDSRLDSNEFPFRNQDGDSRQNNALLYPENCEVL